ncbi:hypothetical protein E8E12_008720 [Didymella heteroderae]|uniref:Uncharacterized protein n=1 Tax=Didymella heteroderae TaxID=1769908 RepID=A0A9P4WSD2_9PLEO|nr:hypothetical protein E8E12_008720 [Didymella heteroderae]
MSSQWESGVKPGFEGQDKIWKITLSHECVELGAPHHMVLNKGHVWKMLEEAISQVRVLIDEQIVAIDEKEVSRRRPLFSWEYAEAVGICITY